MPNNDYANEPNQSRSEEIIQSILDNTEYDEAARSRIEYLLIELKNAIEGGGGGGGVTSYSPLTEKPKIDNHTLQSGNNTSSDLGLQTKLTFDSAPTESSTNPVTSGGVYTALGAKANSDNVYKLALSDADFLPVNTDLDNVKTVGCYYVLSSATAQTITHRPANGGAFRLTVELGAGTIRPRQIYQEYNSYDKYIRAENSSGVFGGWKKVECDLSTKQDTISDLSTIRSGAALGATAVQPVSGKGLSTNDYTTDEKEKLAGIEAQANKTTVDSAFSDSSTNPVQNKVVKSALDGKQATLTTAQLASVNSGITADKLTQDENNILYNIKDGVQNIFKLAAGTRTAGGVTFTINADGTITLSNTATSDAVFILSENLNVSDDVYVLYGDGFISGIFMDTYETGYTNRRTFTTYAVTNSNTKIWRLIVSSGTNCNGVTIRPMMCKKSLFDADPTYQPYALSNAAITPALVECVDNGKKNKVKINISSGTYASIVTTVSNGVITLSSGTASTSPTILTFSEIALPAGNYVLSGCAAGGSDTTYRLDIRSSGITICGIYGNDFVEFTLSAQTTITVNIRLQGGYSIPGSGLVFKPMICEKSLYDVSPTFEPYAMSNAELTNIAVPLSGKTVLNEQANTSQTVTYQMLGADFGDKRSCGVYLIYIVSWGASPVLSVYAAYYSGGVTTYSAITKIAGADATVSVSGDTISVTSSGKIQIIAMQ